MENKYVLHSESVINDSLSKMGLIAKKQLLYLTALTNGLVKLEQYSMQEEPSGDGLPYLLIPYSLELCSFYAVMLQCKKDFACIRCFSRNVCLKKLVGKIENVASKHYKRHYTINELLAMPDESITVDDYYKAVILFLRDLVIDYGYACAINNKNAKRRN